MTKYIAEFIATFTMLLAILEGILLAEPVGSSTLTLVVAAVVSGAAVTILIYGFGKWSGAHMNPAVSTAMWLDNQLNTKTYLGYCVAQLLGSLGAAWVIDVTHRDTFYVMGATVPTLPEGWAWLGEMALTFLLVLVIFRFTDARYPRRSKLAAIAIGLTVTIEILVAGPYTGASMNPSRSFGPAVMEDQTMFHWLYFTAPVVGAAAARYFDLLFRKKAVKKTVTVNELV